MPTLFLHRGTDGERFFFNLTSNVGPNSPNLRADVDLVQFAYFAMSKSQKPINQEVKDAAALVVPGAPYTGLASDPLSQAIVTHQQARGGTQDGHVSVMRGSIGYPTGDGGATFMMVPLVNALRELNPGAFPRLDLFEKCPTELAKFCVSFFIPK